MEQLQKWFQDLDMKMHSGEKLNKCKQCDFVTLSTTSHKSGDGGDLFGDGGNLLSDGGKIGGKQARKPRSYAGPKLCPAVTHSHG